MDDLLPDKIDDDKIAPVRGNLLNRMISTILRNQWTVGDGLLAEKNANGGIISLDRSVLTEADDRVFCRVTGVGSEPGLFVAEQAFLNGGEPTADWATTSRVYDGGDLPEVRALNGMPYMPTDAFYVELLPAVLDTGSQLGETAYVFQHPISPYSAFPVTLEQTGGSAGDETTKCDFTYTVKDLQGNELDTSVDPEVDGYHVRPSVGTLTAATHGLAYYSGLPLASETVLYIAQCNEYLDFEACS